MTDWQTILYNLAGLKFQYNLASWYVQFYVYAMLAILPLSKLADANPYLTLLSSIIVFGAAASFINGRVNMWCDVVNRWCSYTPVLVVGYVAAKQEWIKRMPNLPAYAYLIVLFMVLAARCSVGSIKGFSTDTLLAPIFIFSVVAYLNKANVAGWVRKSFERLGKVSMYMWLLHAVFFSDYSKAIFQTQPVWLNNPFAAFIFTTIVSYLLAEMLTVISGMLSSKQK